MAPMIPRREFVKNPSSEKPALTSKENRPEGEGKANIADAKMTTSVAPESGIQPDQQTRNDRSGRARRIVRVGWVRELLIVLAFCFLTAVMTWPTVMHMRDAVSGRNDPYLIAYTLWWDYHATFTDPLNLFNANILYPYRYTLAFSEHCYGIALVFFPLFALGLRPLTVHSIAIFLGIALSGYGAFRLARTLTGSAGVAWTAGIMFAFMPYRFGMMGQLMYLFSVWVPLLFEALVLFMRERTTRRATWLGVAFFMLGLSTMTWFLLSLIPLAVGAAILLTRYQLWRSREFWRRGAAALGIASLALVPFVLPYYLASRLYGFKRRIDEVQAHSAHAVSWLVAEGRNNLWRGLGSSFPDSNKFQMFPGLLLLLLPLAELFLIGTPTIGGPGPRDLVRAKWIRLLDVIAVIVLALLVLALGFDTTEAFGKIFFRYLRSDWMLAMLAVVVIARLCMAYPGFLRRGEGANLVETIRSPRRGDAFWLGVVLTSVGFLYSIGWNSFFYRILYNVMPGFKGMRAPMRGALFAYLGLALLAGLGAQRLAARLGQWRPRLRPSMVYAIIIMLFLFESNALPFYFIRGEVDPDEVTLRLKNTAMRGGIAYLPMTLDLNHQYTLRAADHLKPLITATSSFNPPLFDEIDKLTNAGTISPQFMNLLEQIPASYLVIENDLIVPERKADYTAFVVSAVAADRLRFVNRFDGKNDLYAVTRIEPGAKSEAALPPELKLRDWASLIDEDPTNLVGRLQNWSQTLYRIHLATSGQIPRYAEFMNNARTIGRGVIAGQVAEDRQLENKLREFVEEWTGRSDFTGIYAQFDNAQYVERLSQNAGLSLDSAERSTLIDGLSAGHETRATVLLKIARHPGFVEKEDNRSLVVLCYFAFLGRNPDDPPDHNLDGLNFWVRELERHDQAKLVAAFRASGEYHPPKDQR